MAGTLACTQHLSQLRVEGQNTGTLSYGEPTLRVFKGAGTHVEVGLIRRSYQDMVPGFIPYGALSPYVVSRKKRQEHFLRMLDP